ncbi:MAG: GTP cyclohydrolase FolE2 [Fimbriimonadaceae bacterium]
MKVNTSEPHPGELHPNGAELADIQATRDDRNIRIDRVGVRGIRFPIQVKDRAKGEQHTVGTFTLTVDLPSHFKGTHMSRFLEALNENGGEVSVHAIPALLKTMRERLHAETSHLDVTFPFFMEKAAPVTGKVGVMEYECGFSAAAGADEDFVILVQAAITTLCPCSKEISARGAHNQRGVVSVKVRTNGFVWLEEIIEMIEGAASCALYPVLKRPDEKWVTEQAYDHPRFVEDVVREVALAFDRDGRVATYEIEVENHESIHAHNAYAYLARP